MTEHFIFYVESNVVCLILFVSMGSAEFRSEADSIQECMRRADIKLYEDKKRSKAGIRAA